MRLLWTLMLVLTFSLAEAQKDHLFQEIQKIIRNEEDVDLSMASGTVIGIVDWDSSYTFSIDNPSKDSRHMVSDTTIFPAGGVTHAQLILLTYHMFQLELIHPEDTIGRFNIEVFKNTWIEHIRLSDLISHRSGLPKILNSMARFKTDPDDEYLHFDSDTIDVHLRNWALNNKRNTSLEHSQYNFYLLSKILWMVKDIRVHDNGRMIPEMHHTYFDDPESHRELLIPSFYTREGRPVNAPHFSGLTNTMGMLTCMEDMMILAKVYLRLSNSDDFKNFCLKEDLTKKRTKDELYSNGGFRYFTTKKSGNLYFMTGVMKGSSAFICFAPKTNTAVVLMSNSGKSVHTLGMHIMRMINYQFTRTY